MTGEIILANMLLLVHMLVVGITVAGGVALFTGRFAKFHKADIFAWAFITCSFGQLISLLFTGGCVFTKWERALRQRANPSADFAKTVLEEYLPFLPEGFIDAVPFLTIAALIGAFLQIRSGTKR